MFSKTLSTFCTELKETFPELSGPVAGAANLTPVEYLSCWGPSMAVLKVRDASTLFTTRNGLLLPGVSLTGSLWSELSENTKASIWKYLRTLALEAYLETGKGLSETDETVTALMEILMEEKLGSKTGFEESMKHLKPLLDRLKDFMSSTPESASGTPFPEIPERLRNGRIAKLAEELTKQFDPREFGIDPELLQSENIEEIMTKLADIFKKDPTKLMTGAKNMAEKIKRRIMGGSINRDELVAEAQEFMNLFKNHPLFKEGLEKMEAMMGGGGLAEMFGPASEPSARRSAVQERLRRKLAARKSGAQSK